MHEQSETIQRKDGKWVNVYGKDLPQAGQQLPGSGVYDTLDSAVSAAKARSDSFGHETALPHLAEPAISTDRPAALSSQAAIDEMERRATSGQLSPRALEAWAELKQRKALTPTSAPSSSTVATPQETGPFRQVGVVATGFNHGLGGWVDLFNDGLKAMGLPMDDQPFMGTAFMDKYFAGSQFTPQNMMESVLQRAGLEVGANVPLAAGMGVVQAGAIAKRAAGASQTLTASTNWEALKNIPQAIVQQLAEISPVKLQALEAGIAAGAGIGAGLAHDIFPEGGRLGEFVGELLGSFTPSVVLGLTRKAIDLAHGVGRTVMGLETEAETKRRLGQTLKDAATPEQVAEGVQKADALGQEVPGLKLSVGEAIKEGSVSDTQIAFERSSPAARAKARDQRGQNIEAVRNYFNRTAPDGNTTRYAETLERERQTNSDLLDLGVARTQAKIDAVRGDISKRAANLLNDLEGRMYQADLRVESRIRAIGPQLSAKQRGEMIRGEYMDELGKFRERSRADYHELDMLGTAELPVASTLRSVAELKAQFPEQFQILSKVNPRAARVLDRLGRDFEAEARIDKALADLEIVGSSRKSDRGGFKIYQEELGQGSTPTVKGIPSNYPGWYRGLTNGNNPLDRQTIEKALDTLKYGTPNGLEEKTIEHVRQAINTDPEFRRSTFYDPVMEDLHHQPSSDLKGLRQVRSDLLALSRQARASDQRVQNYVLHELIGAIDRDIDQLLPGASPYAARYPEHGTLYREVSADYRASVETLMKGTANKLRLVNRYGDYTQYDEQIPALFWRNESTMQDFQKAFQTPEQAHLALRDYALDRFMEAAAHRTSDGRLTIDPAAAAEWMTQHRAKLKAFPGSGTTPGLESIFQDTVKMQEEADALRLQVEAYRNGKKGEALLLKKLDIERRPGEFTQGDIAAGEAELKRAMDLVDRGKHDWEASKASLFLREKASVAGYRIATARDPIAEYEQAVARVKGDPDAVAGLNKAIWEGLTEKLQPRLTGMTGETNIGVFHKELQNWIEGHGKIMERVLGLEGFRRIKTASDVLEHIARGGRDKSDTAINLQVQAALASTWLSRAFAMASGRVGHVFGVTERVATHLTKTFERLTAKQQEAILLESFFDPKVYQTLVHAGTYGADHALVQHQLRLHLVNLSEQQSHE